MNVYDLLKRGSSYILASLATNDNFQGLSLINSFFEIVNVQYILETSKIPNNFNENGILTMDVNP